MTLSPRTAKLREWQARAVSEVLTHTGPDFLATATPAAGKARFALRIVHQYLADRVARRVLVICPTNHLRMQWADAAGLVGIHLDPALTNEQAVSIGFECVQREIGLEIKEKECADCRQKEQRYNNYPRDRGCCRCICRDGAFFREH